MKRYRSSAGNAGLSWAKRAAFKDRAIVERESTRTPSRSKITAVVDGMDGPVGIEALGLWECKGGLQ